MWAQALRFAGVGLVNTAIGFACILLFDLGLGWPSLPANLVGFGIGAMTSYLLNRRLTFRSQRAHREAVPRFALLVLVCWLANAAALVLAERLLQWPSLASQALAVLVYNLLFFGGSRSLVFRA